MIHSELIMASTLNEKFHKLCEQLEYDNPASIVQKKKRPRSKLAYPLAYFKAFFDPTGDTSDIQALLGLIHFGFLCAGSDIDMAEVMGWPHGLTCLQGPANRQGIIGVIITGKGDEWVSAIHSAGNSTTAVQDWGLSCYQQFSKYDLGELFGKLCPDKTGHGGYFLELT